MDVADFLGEGEVECECGEWEEAKEEDGHYDAVGGEEGSGVRVRLRGGLGVGCS